MDTDRIEKAFHLDHRARLRGDRAMQVEEHQRFAESRRKPVLRLFTVNGAASVCNQLPGCVVDRDDDPPTQQPVPGVEPETSERDGRPRGTTLLTLRGSETPQRDRRLPAVAPSLE